MEKEIKKLLTEKYHIDFDSEWFTDEMICLVDDTIKATIEVLNPKKKPLSERKEAFRLNTFKYLDRYSESMMIEFFEYWTQIVTPDIMMFEETEILNIEIALKNWEKNH